jgi:TolB protein
MFSLRHSIPIIFLVLLVSCVSVENEITTTPTASIIQPTPTASPTPSTSPNNNAFGVIAYSSDQDGDFEIWLMNADGSEQRKLTDNNAMDVSPAWSPDGDRIAFISNRAGNDEIYVMNADGTNVRRLTQTADASESFPSWSPDGAQISFDSDRGGNWDVYVMASDGSNPYPLTDHPGEDWISSWSPSGDQIVFESNRDGNYEIYVMDSDVSNLRRVTNNQVHDGFPTWSPHGNHIAFMSRTGGNYDIYVMGPDGTNLQQLTDDRAQDSDPAWSPDGEWLAFVSQRDGNDEIYIVNSDGSNVRQLTDNGAQNWSPAWQPSNIVNASSNTWSGPYFGQDPPRMEAEISAPAFIPSPDFSEYSGSFSPDGGEYYFFRFSHNSESVLLYSKFENGKWSVPEQLAVTAGYTAFEPYVTMDNQRLYFAWGYPVPPGQPEFPYYFVERTPDGWSEPKYAGQGMFLSSTQDGQLYTTDMSSRAVDMKTYIAKITEIDGVFTDYERLPIEPPFGNPAHPCIAPDGSYILFDVGSGNHLFVSFKKADGTWEEPIDLTKHGFDPMAGGAYISPDGEYLFFSLNKDIWWIDIAVIENLRPTD